MSDLRRDTTIPAWLSSLRALLRRSIAMRGLSFAAVAIVLLVLVSLGIDRLFRLSTPARVVAMLLYVGTVGWVAWKYLLQPFWVSLPDRLLADLVEKRFPELYDRLRSSIEFRLEKRGDESNLSEDQRITFAMKDRVLEQADTQLRQLARESVIDGKKILRATLSGGAGVALIILLSAFAPDTMQIWANRNIFFGDAEWPYKTRLTVEGVVDGKIGVPSGDPLEVRVRAEGEDPVQVSIRLFYENESTRLNLPREGDRTFVYNHAAVTEAFEFTVSGGDYRSKPYQVVVLERPTVQDIDVTMTPPAYTERAPIVSSGQIGELAGPAGSSLSLKGKSNKTLRRAWLTAEGQEFELAVNGAEFSGNYDPKTGGAVTIHLEDTEDVPPDQLFQFSVHLIEDRAPKVRLRVTGLGPLISPIARMPLEIDAKDDYKIEHLEIAHQVVDEKNEKLEGKGPLEDPEQASDRILDERIFEVKTLGIEPEKRLNVRVGAIDNDDLNGAKTGYSAVKSFLVVSFEKLSEEFVRREEEQRRVLERLLEREKTARDLVYEMVGNAWKKDGKLDEATIQKMLTLARVERQQARQVSAVAIAVQQVLTEMENNRAAEAEQLGRLAELIIHPLQQLGEDSMPAASVEIGAIRDNEAADKRVELGLELAQRVEDHVSTLEKVIANMTRLESFTEIVKFLRVTINAQDASIKATQNRLENEVNSLFQDDPDAESK